MTVVPSKPALRAESRRTVSKLKPEERTLADTAINARVQALPEYRCAEQVLGYLALPDEPSLGQLMESSVLSGLCVFAPVVADRAHIFFVRWFPADGFCAGLYGSWSPSSEEQPRHVPSIALVPGRAFDATGYRLGRGAGCYDRVLDMIATFATVVGVAYDCQMVDRVPREEHDRSVDVVITEKRVIRPRRQARGR